MKKKLFLVPLLTAALATPAFSAITVHFVEEQNGGQTDVRVSFSGSLSLSASVNGGLTGIRGDVAGGGETGGVAYSGAW